MFSISAEPIENLRLPPQQPSCGARVVFEGTVRNTSQGRSVVCLEYEAMESLACKEGDRILAETSAKFPIAFAACVHRVGRLDVGEIAIRVVVDSGHRSEAFAACQFIVDEVKSRVPIWKREHYADGQTEWINAAG